MEMKKLDGTYLTYQGKPLEFFHYHREKNSFCYGDMHDPAVLFLIVLTNKKFGDAEIPDRVLIQLLSTKDRSLLKQGEKNGLFQALETGLVWLAHELKG